MYVYCVLCTLFSPSDLRSRENNFTWQIFLQNKSSSSVYETHCMLKETIIGCKYEVKKKFEKLHFFEKLINSHDPGDMG